MAHTDVCKKNNIYQHLYVLKTNRKKRYRYREFLVEGVRNINEAVAEGWKIKSFIYSMGDLSDWANNLLRTVPTKMNYRMSQELMRDLSDKDETSELMAVIEMRECKLSQVNLSDNPLILLFDRPSNKGNLGTIIRSCDALGVDCLIVTGHSVDIYDPAVIAASMGSFFHLQIIRIAENSILFDYIERLKTVYPGFKTVGTTAHRQHEVSQIDFCAPVMLMIGNETMGLNHAFQEVCDILATIPMAENSCASSFNVSCAASIMMYEVVRQRGNI